MYAGQNVAVTETGTSFVNERQKVEISLEKAMETNKLFGIGENGEVKNVSFGIFAADELVSTSGTSIPKDGLIEMISPDENGKAVYITIGNLAKISNVSRVTLTKFISGKSNPKPATIGKIAKALNVNVEELIEDTAATVNQSKSNHGFTVENYG